MSHLVTVFRIYCIIKFLHKNYTSYNNHSNHVGTVKMAFSQYRHGCCCMYTCMATFDFQNATQNDVAIHVAYTCNSTTARYQQNSLFKLNTLFH